MVNDEDPRKQQLESHLADRLKETRDVANFSRPKPPEAPGEIERVIEMPGHLGGRKITDKFIRGGTPQPAKPKAASDELPPASRGLEHHLKSRLSEIQDTPIGQGNELERMLEEHRRRRRDMGGS